MVVNFWRIVGKNWRMVGLGLDGGDQSRQTVPDPVGD
jgi:hypothetical protein